MDMQSDSRRLVTNLLVQVMPIGSKSKEKVDRTRPEGELYTINIVNVHHSRNVGL